MKAGMSGPGGLGTGSSSSGFSDASAGTTDRGKSNVHGRKYPGRKVKASPAQPARENPTAAKSARRTHHTDNAEKIRK
jgi:hypothetical protein